MKSKFFDENIIQIKLLNKKSRQRAKLDYYIINGSKIRKIKMIIKIEISSVSDCLKQIER